ncbi:hypothetical protein [Magnetospirillum moscoviense]|uniref:hypothetical protein n=1 Tax=Magnetospirillum moscoviense TaxID=1437059 RepID=UPI0012E96F3D|nr:hypothetical protein [Magnetospirillum moscoviense]
MAFFAENKISVGDEHILHHVARNSENAHTSPALFILTLLTYPDSFAQNSIPKALISDLWKHTLHGRPSAVVWFNGYLITFTSDGERAKVKHPLPRPADPKWRLDPIEPED